MNQPVKKDLALILLCFIILFSCSPSTDKTSSDKVVMGEEILFPEKIANSTIYEVNIRQHTPEGTFRAFIPDIERLKELGIDVLWIMPIQPISLEGRKGSLGSWYAVADYEAVNPEFGTLDDFKALVNKAHELDMYVILDWVPNHTGRDHHWVSEHIDYYTLDDEGQPAYESNWDDIALLDHNNPATRRAMIDAMKYWVNETNIDGFRCDHAGHEIPMVFWEEATDELDQVKDLFWLAEWDNTKMHMEFDGTYNWALLGLSEKVAHGEKNAHDLEKWMKEDLHEFGTKPFRMTMITNHDENAWNGTVFERYGEGHQAFAVFIFTAYGIPMLYSGQEVGLNKRLRFFDKDTVDWSDPLNLQPFYKKLVALKKNNPAIWNGAYGGIPRRINKEDQVFAYVREKEGNQLIGIINFSGEEQSMVLSDKALEGSYTDYFTGEEFSISGTKSLSLGPWQYLISVTNQ